MSDPEDHPPPSRKDPRERARRAEERFRLLVESVRDYAIFMLDPGGHVSTWNDGAERIKGWNASEIIGRHLSVFYPPADVEAGKCEHELAEASRLGRFEDEGWRIRKDGTRFWANVVISAMRDPGGELVGFAKVTRDLTDRRRAEDERLRRLQAEEAVRLRDEFLAIASHELRTPLTALQLQLEGLRRSRGEFGERGDRRLEQATRSAGRLGELVDALLDATKISLHGVELDRAPTDLAALVARAVGPLREGSEAAGCALRVEAEGPIVGQWDALRLSQAVANLVSNAIRYGARGPVDVRVFRDGETAILEVCDRGPGIAEQDLARIFERFERASSWRHYGGLGLGLYVTREIVRAHGGTIDASARAGGGSCFTVRLPLPPKSA